MTGSVTGSVTGSMGGSGSSGNPGGSDTGEDADDDVGPSQGRPSQQSRNATGGVGLIKGRYRKHKSKQNNGNKFEANVEHTKVSCKPGEANSTPR